MEKKNKEKSVKEKTRKTNVKTTGAKNKAVVKAQSAPKKQSNTKANAKPKSKFLKKMKKELKSYNKKSAKMGKHVFAKMFDEAHMTEKDKILEREYKVGKGGRHLRRADLQAA